MNSVLSIMKGERKELVFLENPLWARYCAKSTTHTLSHSILTTTQGQYSCPQFTQEETALQQLDSLFKALLIVSGGVGI